MTVVSVLDLSPVVDGQTQAQALHHTIDPMVVLRGGPERVRAIAEEQLVATGADELMVTTLVHDHEQRKASYSRLAEALDVAPGQSAAA